MTDQLPPSAFERSDSPRSDSERSNSGPAPEQVAAPVPSNDSQANDALTPESASHAADPGGADHVEGELAGGPEPERPRRRRRGGRGRRRSATSASASQVDVAGDEASSDPSSADVQSAASDGVFEAAAEPRPDVARVDDVGEAPEEDAPRDEAGAQGAAGGEGVGDGGARRSRRRRGGRRRSRRSAGDGGPVAEGAAADAEQVADATALERAASQPVAFEPSLEAAPAIDLEAGGFDDDFDIPAAAAAGPLDASDAPDARGGDESRSGRRRGRRRGRRGGGGSNGGASGGPSSGPNSGSNPSASPDAGPRTVERPAAAHRDGAGAESSGGPKRSRRGRRRRGAAGASAQGPVGVEWIPGEENELALVPVESEREPDNGSPAPQARVEPKQEGGGRRRGKRKDRAESQEVVDVDAGARPKPGRPNIILVNAADREEIRVAVVEGGQIVDFQMHVKRHETLVNDIYRGKVVNLEPAIGAAFIDFGEGRNGFLHTSDVLAVYGDPDWRLDKLLTHKIDPEEWDEKSSQPHVAAELTSARGARRDETQGGARVAPRVEEDLGADSDDEGEDGDEPRASSAEPSADEAHDGLDHDDLHERLLAHHDERGVHDHDEHDHHDHDAPFDDHSHAPEIHDATDGLELLEVLEDPESTPGEPGADAREPAKAQAGEVEHLGSLRARSPLERSSSDELAWSEPEPVAQAPHAGDSDEAAPEAPHADERAWERPTTDGGRGQRGAGPRGAEGARGEGARGEGGRSGRGGRGAKGSRDSEARRHGRPRARPRLPITDLLEKGQSVVVQVTKDAIGDKGPTLTTYISIPGRYLVLMPSMSRTGVSRKIEDEKERRRLKRILESLDVPEGMGVIVRTAGTGCTRDDLRRDLDYLMLLWDTFGKRLNLGRGPAPLYEESDVAIRTIRDLFNDHTEAVYVDDEKVYQRVREFMEKLIPEKVDRVQLHTGPKPLFHTHNVEQDFERIFARRIDLASGGSIVLDQTEALVAIDVNSGKTRSEGFDFENIALRTNLDAVKEIARQIRLRDLGGIIVCDFIDMQRSSSRRQVERALRDAMDSDRARSKLGRISQFGLLELTRQRLGPGLSKMLFANCPRCRGSGRIRTVESRVGAILRRLGAALTLKGFQKVELRAAPEVVEHLRRYCSTELRDLETRHERQIELFAAADQLEDSVLRYLRADGREVRPGGRRKR